MKKIISIIILNLMLIISLNGCIETEPVDPGDITLTVDNVEKRLYDDNGNPASSGNIFLYVYFTIKNEAHQELSTNAIWFELDSESGETYKPYWIFGVGGSTAKSISKGASSSYYIAFQIPENSDVTTNWNLEYDGWQSKKSTNLANIQTGFQDIYLATLTINDYYFTDTGDFFQKPSEGNTFIYVNLTLNNSEDNSNPISTSIILFKLYTTVGGYSPKGGDNNIPNNINIGSEYSWYLYFEIPEDAILNKLVYNTLGITPAEAFFEQIL